MRTSDRIKWLTKRVFNEDAREVNSTQVGRDVSHPDVMADWIGLLECISTLRPTVSVIDATFPSFVLPPSPTVDLHGFWTTNESKSRFLSGFSRPAGVPRCLDRDSLKAILRLLRIDLVSKVVILAADQDVAQAIAHRLAGEPVIVVLPISNAGMAAIRTALENDGLSVTRLKLSDGRPSSLGAVLQIGDASTFHLEVVTRSRLVSRTSLSAVYTDNGFGPETANWGEWLWVGPRPTVRFALGQVEVHARKLRVLLLDTPLHSQFQESDFAVQINGERRPHAVRIEPNGSSCIQIVLPVNLKDCILTIGVAEGRFSAAGDGRRLFYCVRGFEYA